MLPERSVADSTTTTAHLYKPGNYFPTECAVRELFVHVFLTSHWPPSCCAHAHAPLRVYLYILFVVLMSLTSNS